MKARRIWLVALGAGALLLAGQITFAADAAVTTIEVDGMHCAACAKKITSQVQTVSGVAAAKADAKTGVVTVSPKSNMALSPKGLWEAVEKSGYTPTKIVGPAGTFTKKPKS